MLNKYLHLISMKESGEAVGLRKGLGKHLLLIISCSQFPHWKMGPPSHALLSEGCPCEQYILESGLENTLQQIKGNFHRD